MRTTVFASFCAQDILRRAFGTAADIRALPPSPYLPSETASHADMLMLYAQGRLFAPAYYYQLYPSLFSGIDVTLSEERHTSDYPGDVLFNAFILNGYLYGKTDSIAAAVRTHCKSSGILPCSVRQGYAKCSCAVLPNAVITADAGIYRALQKNGTDALLISEGGIGLHGYAYGFIGGASFYLDGKLYFFGAAESHPSYIEIAAFCEGHGAQVVSLGSGELYDYGGAVIIRE